MDRMNLADMLDFYAYLHDVENWDAMLQDYVLTERLNRADLNRVILTELGNACPYVTDTSTFKFALETFFIKYKTNIDKLAETLFINYNPIINKDYTRKTDEENNNERHSVSEGNIEEDITENHDETTTLNVSAYNDGQNVYTPRNQSIEDGTDTTDRNQVSTDVTQINTDETKDKTEHIAGTDGAYQDLIEKERKAAQFSIYNWIISRMRKELFLLVY